MKNNPILDANLKQIARYNPELCEKLMKLESLTQDIQFSNTAMQEANLSYNGVPLHDLIGAEIEARNIFSKVKNNRLMMHIVYGFGIGYLVQQFALKSKGIVLIYEPSLEILASTLEVADLSKELSNPDVYVFNDFENLKKAYDKLRISNSDTVITFLPSYAKIFGEDLKKFASEMQNVMGRSILNENYFKTRLRPAVKFVCENISYLLDEPLLLDFKDIYKDKTAVVVSAGPSLDRNIETLKKYKDNVVIIAVSQATRALAQNGITPDFVVCIEQFDSSTQLDGVDISNSYLILEPYTNTAMHKMNFKRKISYPSCTSIANLVWTNFAKIDATPYVSSGTVSYTALYSAMYLGCKDIILIGQDLAYCDGKCYSNGTNRGLICKENPKTGKVEIVVANGAEDKLKQALYGHSALNEEDKDRLLQKYVANINSKLYYVEGIKGNKLPTTADYGSFISQFEEFAKDYGDKLNLYNTSLKGAKIKGFKDLPLENLLEKTEKLEKVTLTKAHKYNLNEIKTSIQKEIETLNNVQRLMLKAEKLIGSYERELEKNKNTLTHQAGAYFKQLMILYVDISENYSKKSLIYKFINKSASYTILYNLRLNPISDVKSIVLIFDNLKQYFTGVSKDIKIITDTLEKKVEYINEMLDSKS